MTDIGYGPSPRCTQCGQRTAGYHEDVCWNCQQAEKIAALLAALEAVAAADGGVGYGPDEFLGKPLGTEAVLSLRLANLVRAAISKAEA